jgi:hypothetical protein
MTMPGYDEDRIAALRRSTAAQVEAMRDGVPAEFRAGVAARITTKVRLPIGVAWRLFGLLAAGPVSTEAAELRTGVSVGTIRNAVAALRCYVRPLRFDVQVDHGVYRFSDETAARLELTRLREAERRRRGWEGG